ncbi:hypothetical protein ACQP1P_17475 [Dactylosporangium sp. CA-052675]|uniref:hypothetical protein n=1 Tax=Dactylosporangium sp. CA-052675 TaxID=3239927 RepID=UPI003D89B211
MPLEHRPIVGLLGNWLKLRRLERPRPARPPGLREPDVDQPGRRHPRTDFTADHLGANHVAAFRASAQAALTAFRRPGMLTQRYGPAPGWRLVEQVSTEMLATLAAVHEIYGELPRTPGGSFAPARPVPDQASAADRLAAYLGRDVGWTPHDRCRDVPRC